MRIDEMIWYLGKIIVPFNAIRRLSIMVFLATCANCSPRCFVDLPRKFLLRRIERIGTIDEKIRYYTLPACLPVILDTNYSVHNRTAVSLPIQP